MLRLGLWLGVRVRVTAVLSQGYILGGVRVRVGVRFEVRAGVKVGVMFG